MAVKLPTPVLPSLQISEGRKGGRQGHHVFESVQPWNCSFTKHTQGTPALS